MHIHAVAIDTMNSQFVSSRIDVPSADRFQPDYCSIALANKLDDKLPSDCRLVHQDSDLRRIKRVWEDSVGNRYVENFTLCN